MIEIVEFTRDYVDKVIEYEKKLRQEEPDTEAGIRLYNEGICGEKE